MCCSGYTCLRLDEKNVANTTKRSTVYSEENPEIVKPLDSTSWKFESRSDLTFALRVADAAVAHLDGLTFQHQHRDPSAQLSNHLSVLHPSLRGGAAA